MGAVLTGMIYQAGGDVLDENEQPTFNGPEGVDALTQWKMNIVDPQVTSNAQGDPYQDFAQEQDVLSFGGPNALSFVYQINPSLEGRVTVASMPDAGPNYGGGASYGFHYVVSANATEQERAAAWHFLDFLTADANRWFANTGLLQPKIGWYEEPAAEAFEGLDVFVQDLEDSRPLPRTRFWSQLQAAFVGAVERVAYEDAEPQASLDQAAQEYLAAIGG
jgi:ABC-type glycerol-3-phosphate transport system substrate-binding protein